MHPSTSPAITTDGRAHGGARHNAAQVGHIKPIYRTMMRLQLQGASNREISAQVGLTERAVCIIIHSDLYKSEFEKLQQAADGHVIVSVSERRQRISDLCGLSLAQLEDMLKGKRELEKKRADVCFKFLELDGFSAHATETPADYAHAAQQAYARRKAAARANGDPITVIQVNGETVNLTLPSNGNGAPPVVVPAPAPELTHASDDGAAAVALPEAQSVGENEYEQMGLAR